MPEKKGGVVGASVHAHRQLTDGQTVYLPDQTTQKPSLDNPPLQPKPPGNPCFTAPLHPHAKPHGFRGLGKHYNL